MSQGITSAARWSNILTLILGPAIWLINFYKLATEWRTIGLLDGLTAGMIFFIGPALIFESLNKIRNKQP